MEEEPRPVTVYDTPALFLRWETVTHENGARELKAWVRYQDGREKLVGIQGLRMAKTWETA